jgi:hypothetical protein
LERRRAALAGGRVSRLRAEGDKVVVLTTSELGGETTDGADVLIFNDAGKLVAFEALGGTTQTDRIIAK